MSKAKDRGLRLKSHVGNFQHDFFWYGNWDAHPKLIKVMDKYVCVICGYIYDPAEGDPESGIAPGTAFEDIPEDWTCPACGVGKEHFEKYK